MRKTTLIMSALAVMMLFVSAASAGTVTLDVKISSAPNVFGSPSWNGYAANALNSLENNLGNIGDRNTDPTAYEILGNGVAAGDMMVTSFKSWRGVALPGAPFHNELGNRLHGGLHAYGDGTTQFALEDLNFHLHSSDGDALHFAGDFLGLDYTGSTRYGVHWGADRVKGGGDDIYYMSGNGTTLVDEIVYVGVGNAYWPGGGVVPPGTEQFEIDETVAYINKMSPLKITFDYWIEANDGQIHFGSASVTTVPLPSMALAGLFTMATLFGLGLYKRRLRKLASTTA